METDPQRIRREHETPGAPPPSKARSDLERLLDRVADGSIEDVDELQPQDIELLRSYYGDGEELQDILDRLRSGDDER